MVLNPAVHYWHSTTPWISQRARDSEKEGETIGNAQPAVVPGFCTEFNKIQRNKSLADGWENRLSGNM